MTLFDVAERIEAVMRREKKMFPNIDWMSAVSYHTHGDSHRDVHASLRHGAHVGMDGAHRRATADNKIIRPAAQYVGPEPRPWIPSNSESRSRAHVLGDFQRSPKPDQVFVDIADYVSKYVMKSPEAYDTARLCLMDTLGCGLEALEYPACTKLLGPIVPGTSVLHGASVPGTQFQLDPVRPLSTSAP